MLVPTGRRWGPRSRRATAEKGVTLTAALMLAPALIGLLAFRILPLLSAIIGSMQHVRFGVVTNGFVGLENYILLVQSPTFQSSLETTLFFSLLVNPLQILAALAIATLYVQRIPGVAILRTLVFVPVVVPIAVASLIWGVALRPDGVVNSLLQSLGLPAQPFMTSVTQALPSIILLVSWIGIGYWSVFLIAGLRDIPPEYSEAAAIDGAGWWRIYRSITLPLMTRPLAFVLVADSVANFLLFAPVQILTQGGPQGSTDLVMYETYQEGFLYANPNVALPMTVLLMLVIVGTMVLQFSILRRVTR